MENIEDNFFNEQHFIEVFGKNLSEDNIFDIDSLDYNKQEKLLILQDKKQNIELRKKYADKIFNFIQSWSFLVFLILLLQGSNYKYENFNWDNKVIITLITTTFIQILGLMIIVLKYLFPNKKH